MGLFKKMAIADRLAPLVDPVFQSPEGYKTAATWVALVAYSLQIYCDFSGYSDIAIGTAHMLGFKLPVNFNMPYLSRNISEFWRRWHISLSSWLRDYVYLSFDRNHTSESRTVMGILFTMTLCGLWHGANWTYVVFGLIQGIMLLTHRRFRAFCKLRPGLARFLEGNAGVAIRVTITYLTVIIFTMLLFRSPDFKTTGEILRRLIIPSNGGMIRTPIGPWSLVVAFGLVALCHGLVESGRWKKIAAGISPPLWGLSYATVFLLACLLNPSGHKAFVYFQF
jgi:alginate O-acetyltransferase complex protein AlgI